MEMISVGVITKAHGIKGHVIVLPFTFDSSRFKKLKTVYIGSETQSYTVESVDVGAKGVRLKLSEINTRNLSESLVKKEIMIPETEKLPLPKDQFYYDDLLLCDVYNQFDKKIGKLVGLLEGVSNEIYVIKNDTGKEILIPVVKQFIKKIDIEAKRIDIEEIPGLVD